VLRDPLDEELMAQQLPQAQELEWVRRRKSAVNFASPFRDPKTGQPLTSAKKQGLNQQQLIKESPLSGSPHANGTGSSSSIGSGSRHQGLSNDGVKSVASALAADGARNGASAGLSGPLADELDVADGLGGGGLGGSLPHPSSLGGIGGAVDETVSEEAMELAYLAADTPIYDPVASFAAASARADTAAAEPAILPESASSASSSPRVVPTAKPPAEAAAAAVAPGGRHAGGLVLPPADAHRTKRRKPAAVVPSVAGVATAPAAAGAPAAADSALSSASSQQSTASRVQSESLAEESPSSSGRPPSPALEAAATDVAAARALRTPSPLPVLSPISVVLSSHSSPSSSAQMSPTVSPPTAAAAASTTAGAGNTAPTSASASAETIAATTSTTAAAATAAKDATSGTADPNKGALAAALESGPSDYSNLRLPEGWVVAFSRREQRHYFFNTATNTAAWVPPPGTTPL